MPPSITVSAPAKLNLAVHIHGRSANGYHLLESLVVFTELADTITLKPSDTITLEVRGEFAKPSGAPSDNLVLCAARALQNAANYQGGAHIALTKNIPVGAGLGGGSSDAAATLRVLNDFWKLKLDEAQLLAIATPLGADVPMCLLRRPLVARGVGEIITPLPPNSVPNMAFVLAYPNVHLASADVFRVLNAPAEVAGAKPMELPQFSAFSPFAEWLHRETRNDLQRPAIAVSPIVAEVLRAMETALPAPALVRMTGSGSCCFALFADTNEAQRYAVALAARHPHWWVRAIRIR